jgi:hypothetical protein
MIDWFRLPTERKIDFLTTVNGRTGIRPQAIEKDWWVTLVLYAIFSIPEIKGHIIFKGGTSLSKGWDLIQRFSEDIDLALDRKILGFKDEMSKTQLRKLRKASCSFVRTDLKKMIQRELLALGLHESTFNLVELEQEVWNKDPKPLKLIYKSVLEESDYLQQHVLMEIGARSMMEPTEIRELHSIIGQTLQDEKITDFSIDVPIVIPRRTFLEKIFLLHEEFSKPAEDIRVERLSRHLYDLERIMDTEHGQKALFDKDLFISILKHRQMFTPVEGVNYNNLTPGKMHIVPPQSIISEWEKDYKSMQKEMIYGESLNFETLVGRIKVLNARINSISLQQ